MRRRVPSCQLDAEDGYVQHSCQKLIEPHKLLIASPESTVREATELMASRGVGAVLVVDREELLGIFTERDVVFRVVARRLDTDATRLT